MSCQRQEGQKVDLALWGSAPCKRSGLTIVRAQNTSELATWALLALPGQLKSNFLLIS
jgi:hypothetical protein